MGQATPVKSSSTERFPLSAKFPSLDSNDKKPSSKSKSPAPKSTATMTVKPTVQQSNSPAVECSDKKPSSKPKSPIPLTATPTVQQTNSPAIDVTTSEITASQTPMVQVRKDDSRPESKCTAKRSAKSGGGDCGAVPVSGFDKCPAHLYAATGTSLCTARSATGAQCKNRVALGTEFCAQHLVVQAALRNVPPPAPGQPLPPAPVSAASPKSNDPPPYDAGLLHALDVEERELQLTAATAMVPPFHLGRGNNPAPARMTGFWLRQLHSQPPPSIPTLAQWGLVRSTADSHRRILRLLAAADEELLANTLPQLIIKVCSRLATGRKWRASTLHRNLCAAQGALKLLPLYLNTTDWIVLADDPIWSQAMRAAAIAAREEIPHRPIAMTPEQMASAIKQETSLATKALLVLCWYLAARPGCVLQLERRDVYLCPPSGGAGVHISVTFVRGKAVRSRGAYTVHSTRVIPP